MDTITAGQTVTMTNSAGTVTTAKVLFVHPEGVYPVAKANVEMLDGRMRGQVLTFAISRMTPVAS